ncbi:MAG: MoxR family ATPase [Desulfurococcaceae archaeon]
MIDLDDVRSLMRALLSEVSRVYVGKEWLVKLSVVTLFSMGHLLIQGPPGTGKTLLAKALAKAMGGTFRRVQGHPDVLPSDIVGFNVYRPDGTSSLVRGPVFSNVLLYDELNRTPTRSQAALLEAMEEGQATIDGVPYPLPRPFMVIATMIPAHLTIGGTFNVAETLADRFWASVDSPYSDPEEEDEMLSRSDEIAELPVEAVATPEAVIECNKAIAGGVHVAPEVRKYVVDLVSALRAHEAVLYGPSHRASIHLYRLSRTLAALEGRDFVLPDDVKALFVNVVAHRTFLRGERVAGGMTSAKLAAEILSRTSVPK